MGLKAWEYVNERGRVVPCAWCQREMGVTARTGESHGICQRHVAIWLAELEARAGGV